MYFLLSLWKAYSWCRQLDLKEIFQNAWLGVLVGCYIDVAIFGQILTYMFLENTE